MLVEQTLRLVRSDLHPRILDLGTGSGAIGISLALELPEADLVLADVSGDALEVATINVEKYALSPRVSIVLSDLLNNFVDQKFDLIVANLPYIGERKYRFISADVEKYEPHVALFGGEDGLELYKKMFQQLGHLVEMPRFILGEFGFAQSEDMRLLLNNFFERYGASIEILPDLTGIDRVFIVSL
jgi:release factor glutamine methyltransferase